LLTVALVVGWLFVIGVLGIGMLVLSVGGVGWIGLVPFVGCAFVALFQRARRRLTSKGTKCVAAAAMPVAFGTVVAILEVHRGDGYATFLMGMLAAVVVVAVDAVDRLMRRTVQHIDASPG
jgi:hypothetical protein